MLLNRPEFALVDTAALHLGAVPFSVYNTSSPEQISYRFGNAGNTIVITEQLFLPAIAAATGVGHLDRVSGDDGAGRSRGRGGRRLRLRGVLACGQAGGRPDADLHLGHHRAAQGRRLTHASMLAEIRGCHAVIPVRQGDRTVSYLPAAHVADRWYTHYMSMTFGLTITYVPDQKAVVAALPEVRPTV